MTRLTIFVIAIFCLLVPSSAYSTQYVYDSSVHPESDEARLQIEYYCSLDIKHSLESNISFMNSTHYITSKDCVWKEMPICGEGTVFFEGRCEKLEMHRGPGSCLIATATFGSELAPQVQMLREIRDNILLSTYSGTLFMNGFNTVYYSFSPQVAQLENENLLFKDAVKIFITPMITMLSIMTLAEDSEFQVITLGISTIGLIVGMYVVAPIIITTKVSKKIRKSK